MSKIYVLDTGVLVSTWTDKKKESEFITTPQIIGEIRNRLSRFRAETLFLLDKMEERTPNEEDVQKTEAAAASTGDLSELSRNDLELIALALTVSREISDVTLVSTDFAVLNTASHLGLKILDPNKKFGQEIIWIMKCPACNYRSKKPTRETECPTCGTEMRRSPLKKRKVR
ncbi:MAG: NOB1 family endonuclease [Candidatus Thorarchaeota archaeon]